MTPAPLPVAHVVERYLGLTETFIYDYLAAFREVRPVVVARELANLDAFPLPSGASLHRSCPRRGSAAWAAAAVRRRLWGGDPHLERVLARERVRVIHAHFGPTACALLDLAQRTGLPLWTSFYGYDASLAPVVAAFRERYRRLFEAGSLVLVEGPAMRRRLEALGCPPGKIEIQRIGIDPTRYRFTAREDPGGGPLTLLQCGRMIPKKGYATALDALAEARRHDGRLRLRIVGDGPDRAAIEARIRERGLEGAVTLLGACPRATFVDEMRAAHLYLQPSQEAPDGDSEGGAPTALLEAQASGLPILATQHDDIPYVVREGESALLSDAGDVSSLAANMLRLAAEPERWAAMGRAGRAHVEARHDVRRLASDLEARYAATARGAPQAQAVSRSEAVLSWGAEIERLACPRCRGSLAEADLALACRGCGVRFDVREGVPDLLPWSGGAPGPEWARWREKLDLLQAWRRSTWGRSETAGEHRQHAEGLAARFFQFLRLPEDGAVLEIGCGSGELRRFLAGCAYWGLDPLLALPGSPAVARTRHESAAGVFLRGVGECLPLADGAFEGVLLCQTLDHCLDPARVIREARRVLKPGGLLGVMQSLHVARPAPPVARLRAAAGRLKSRLLGRWRPDAADTKTHPLERSEVRGLVESELQVEEEIACGSVVFLRAVKRERPARGGHGRDSAG